MARPVASANRYRDRATYHAPTYTTAPTGEDVESGSSQATLRCEARAASARELAVAATRQATITHVVEHRWPGFTPSADGRYVLDDGRVLRIVGVTRQGYADVIVAECVEVVD